MNCGLIKFNFELFAGNEVWPPFFCEREWQNYHRQLHNILLFGFGIVVNFSQISMQKMEQRKKGPQRKGIVAWKFQWKIPNKCVSNIFQWFAADACRKLIRFECKMIICAYSIDWLSYFINLESTMTILFVQTPLEKETFFHENEFQPFSVRTFTLFTKSLAFLYADRAPFKEKKSRINLKFKTVPKCSKMKSETETKLSNSIQMQIYKMLYCWICTHNQRKFSSDFRYCSANIVLPSFRGMVLSLSDIW